MQVDRQVDLAQHLVPLLDRNEWPHRDAFRTRIADHDALVDLLKMGHVSGAILDVFASEPLPAASPLWNAPNLIVNPHVSSDDLDGYMRETMNLVCRNLRFCLAGRRLSNVVDPARGY